MNGKINAVRRSLYAHSNNSEPVLVTGTVKRTGMGRGQLANAIQRYNQDALASYMFVATELGDIYIKIFGAVTGRQSYEVGDSVMIAISWKDYHGGKGYLRSAHARIAEPQDISAGMSADDWIAIAPEDGCMADWLSAR